MEVVKDAGSLTREERYICTNFQVSKSLQPFFSLFAKFKVRKEGEGEKRLRVCDSVCLKERKGNGRTVFVGLCKLEHRK